MQLTSCVILLTLSPFTLLPPYFTLLMSFQPSITASTLPLQISSSFVTQVISTKDWWLPSTTAFTDFVWQPRFIFSSSSLRVCFSSVWQAELHTNSSFLVYCMYLPLHFLLHRIILHYETHNWFITEDLSATFRFIWSKMLNIKNMLTLTYLTSISHPH